MKLSIPKSELKRYIGMQLNTFFPDKFKFSGKDINVAFELALERTEWCFKHISSESYFKDNQVLFSHLHSDQYSQFLYFFSNSLFLESQNKPICDKLILLNKALNGMFYSYKGKLPEVFLFVHPVGTVIGNANYSNFLVIYQNVTINTGIVDENGDLTPRIGKGVFLSSGAKIVGNKSIGNRTSIGVNTLIFNREIPGDSIAYTKDDGSLVVEGRKKVCAAQKFFNVKIE